MSKLSVRVKKLEQKLDHGAELAMSVEDLRGALTALEREVEELRGALVPPMLASPGEIDAKARLRLERLQAKYGPITPERQREFEARRATYISQGKTPTAATRLARQDILDFIEDSFEEELG